MKTSKKQFNQFKKSFTKYVEKFKLDDWTFYIDHKNKTKDAYATTEVNLKEKTININFQKDLDDFNGLNIDLTAKHEAIHCLLGELSELGYYRFTDRNQLYQAEESLVRKLERLL